MSATAPQSAIESSTSGNPVASNHSDIGQPLSNCLSEHQPIHLRHDDIGEDQIDVQSGADHPQGFHAGRCRQHVAAEVLTYETRGRFHRMDIVIDNEDDESSEWLVSAHRFGHGMGWRYTPV